MRLEKSIYSWFRTQLIDTYFSQIWPLSLLNVAAASYQLTISSSRLLAFSSPIHPKADAASSPS